MVKKIKTKITKSDGSGLFHDSRRDVAMLSRVCNELIDKVNQLTDKVNELDKLVNKVFHRLYDGV
ncbi:hypothetical protein [Bacillus sp. SM2101]|uniref:hypothetical protein n=1 Tax=Bacillus sp. SM2101 TaxID=2805366 RepID=UPI001BDE1DC2|nr:hypothetical protein [Bacillus sp. SM2101]